MSDLSPNLQLLLRAGTAFKGCRSARTYPDIVEDFTISRLKEEGKSSEPDHEEDENVGKLVRDDEFWAIAQKLLALVGRPDATHAEMSALGRIFWCGRCAAPLRLTWDNLVRHFAKEERRWRNAQKQMRLRRHGQLVYNRTHGFEPGSPTPFAYILAVKESEDREDEVRMESTLCMQCMMCERLGIKAVYAHLDPDEGGSAILEHLGDVHNLTTAIMGQHFCLYELDLDHADPWEDHWNFDSESDY
ncbi:DNA mismatch repair protein [Ceratobasidium sp. AG-Ba]|nr:DNA mismatch repair protein [Ceratobasidium sp. AG-Ba]